MIVVQGWVKVREADAAALREAARELAVATREEAGNRAYAFAEDVNEPGLFHIVERWESEEAAAAHMLSASLAAFTPKLAAMPNVRLWIARYDVAEERVLMEA